MGVDFGSLTTSKMTFKINPQNKNAMTLNTDYDKQWNIFEKAKEKYESAQGSGNGGEQPPDITSIQNEMEDAQAKLEKLQTVLMNEANNNKEQNNNTPTEKDEQEKGKVKDKPLGQMMA